jgi:hypothetical protein
MTEFDTPRADRAYCAMIDQAMRTKHTVRIYGTGHEAPDDLDGLHYAGTFQLAGGALVFHAFIYGC